MGWKGEIRPGTTPAGLSPAPNGLFNPEFKLILLPAPPGEIPAVCVNEEGKPDAGLTDNWPYGFPADKCEFELNDGIEIGWDVDVIGILY